MCFFFYSVFSSFAVFVLVFCLRNKGTYVLFMSISRLLFACSVWSVFLLVYFPVFFSVFFVNLYRRHTQLLNTNFTVKIVLSVKMVKLFKYCLTKFVLPDFRVCLFVVDGLLFGFIHLLSQNTFFRNFLFVFFSCSVFVLLFTYLLFQQI